MSRNPHGPSLPGTLGALLTAGMVLTTWGVAAWAIWAWAPNPVRAWFGS